MLKPYVVKIVNLFEAYAAEALPTILHSKHIIAVRTPAETRAFYFSAWDLSNRLQWKKQHSLQIPEALDYMRRIVAFTREHHIKLDVYVSPQHALYWEIARQGGMQPDVDAWLRTLATITPYREYTSDIDFSNHLETYFPNDPLHFDPTVGEHIFNDILTLDSHHLVTNENVERSIIARHAAMNRWMQRNPYYEDVFRYSQITPQQTGWENILPIPYTPAKNGWTIVRYRDVFYALPAKQAPYDLRRFLTHGYKMLSAPTLAALEAKL